MEEWLEKLTHFAEMNGLSSLITEKTSEFIGDWKPLLDFLHTNEGKNQFVIYVIFLRETLRMYPCHQVSALTSRRLNLNPNPKRNPSFIFIGSAVFPLFYPGPQ